MANFTDFQTIATSLTSAANIARMLIDADKAFDKAELKLKLADLMTALADARAQLADVKDQTYRLGDKLAETEKKLAFAGTLVFVPPYYIADGKRDEPYCATCWDARQKLAVHLYRTEPGYWVCNTCKNHVQDSNYSDSASEYEPTPSA